MEKCQELSFFNLTEPPAYAMSRAMTMKGVDHCYEAIHQASGNTISYAAAYNVDKEDKVCFVGRPLIVTTVPLFSAKLDAAGQQIEVREIDSAMIIWNGLGTQIYISVVHERALAKFLAEAQTAFKFVFENCVSEIESAFVGDGAAPKQPQEVYY